MKFDALEANTCFCSYATMTSIPNRFPRTMAIVSAFTLLLEGTELSLWRRSRIFSYSSSVGSYIASSCISRCFASSSGLFFLNMMSFRLCFIIIHVIDARHLVFYFKRNRFFILKFKRVTV